MVVALAAVHVPDVRVSVEEDDPERPVDGGVRAELAEHDQMISPQAECPRPRADDRLELLRELTDGPLGVPGRDACISQVGDRDPPEDLSLLYRVVRTQRDRSRADRLRPEPGPWPVRRRRVERNAEHSDVHALRVN